MVEWLETNKYSSFNSMKGLTYFNHYREIVAWLEYGGYLPPPIEASLDPINVCNQRCYYCNSQRYLRDHPAGLQAWDKGFIQTTLERLSETGVRAFCWGGGGEALLNKNLHGMTQYGVSLGMECSIITNGVLLNEFTDELLLCRWIGVSLDSSDFNVYRKVRGTDDCEKVLTNIKELVKKRTKTDIAIKVLVLPETLGSLTFTCHVAKDLGVQDFHVRPVDLERKDNKNPTKLNLDMDFVQTSFDYCHSLETKDFHVYTVQHKYDSEFHVKHDFKKCLASPLVTQICTDKRQYICLDHRLEEKYVINEWGSEQHRELLKSVVPDRDCGRCTFGAYNEQIENCVLEDRLCKNFP